MLYKLEVPVPNYYNDYNEDVFYQELYFEKDTCPTKEEVRKEVERLHKKDSELEFPEYDGTWEEVLKSLDLTEEFPEVHGNCIASNSFCNLPGYGKKPLSIERITPITIK